MQQNCERKWLVLWSRVTNILYKYSPDITSGHYCIYISLYNDNIIPWHISQHRKIQSKHEYWVKMVLFKVDELVDVAVRNFYSDFVSVNLKENAYCSAFWQCRVYTNNTLKLTEFCQNGGIWSLQMLSRQTSKYVFKQSPFNSGPFNKDIFNKLMQALRSGQHKNNTMLKQVSDSNLWPEPLCPALFSPGAIWRRPH